MNEILLNLHLTAHQNDFVQFMQIDSFPKYKVQTKTLSLLTAASQGYESAATSQYLPKAKKHILTFGNNIALHKQLVYHEFTHILDAEMYARGDSSRYAMLSGFTEYHASQVELMKLLGAKTITEQISFSMDTIIDTVVGKITVFKYIEDKRLHAVQLFNRTDFPADLPTLITAIGLLFNYWGLRSICAMYATDYVENNNNSAFLNHISVFQFAPANRHMHGWLDNNDIEISMRMYWSIICSLLNVNKLV